jgi:ubiquinone/menaquinone biosynthesis C-methylase UbiE
MSEASQMFTDGKAYERMMGRWSRLVGAQFLDWLAVPPGQRWLDVGCGNGAFTEEMIGHCAPVAVTGIDPSEEQLVYARTRPGARLAVFQRGDAQVLPFADASFDIAVMALVIAFLPDPAKAVADMARVVRPGGWVATYMWDVPGAGVPLQPIHNALKTMGIDAPRPPNPTASTQEALQAVWTGAGLTDIQARVIRVPISYTDFDDFWDSNIVPIGPHGKLLQSLSPDLKEQLRQTLRQQLPIMADGRITYEAFSNAISGRLPN